LNTFLNITFRIKCLSQYQPANKFATKQLIILQLKCFGHLESVKDLVIKEINSNKSQRLK